jgi:hypothetical protein
MRNAGGGTDPDYVYGSVNFASTAAPGGNTVNITGGTGRNVVFGAYHRLDIGDTQANGSHVTVSGGTVSGVNSGSASCYSANCTATANGNTVDIQGGTIANSVWGGYASGNNKGIASNNTVKISGAPTLTEAWLYGGYARGNTSSTSSGNRLEISTSGLSAYGVSDFQQLSFTLPASLAPGGTVLALSNTAYLGTDIAVSVSAAPGLVVHPGNVFKLIDGAHNISGSVAAASKSGTLLGYGYTLGIDPADPTNLILTIGAQIAPTGAATAVPTLHEAALALLALLLAGMAAYWSYKKGTTPADD